MPPWTSIETIMFDMDGTLLDLHFDNYFWLTLVPRVYSQVHGISEQTALSIIRNKYSEAHGTLNWYCLDYWEEKLKLDITELKTTIKHKICIRPNAEKLLKKLQTSNNRLLLITNAHPSSMAIKLNHSGIGKYFHQTISSHRLNLAKENGGFWESLRKIEPYNPECALLFDDSLPVLRQAKKEGIRYLYGIKQPDSQKPALLPAEFPQIENFADIIPSMVINE